MTSAWKPSAAWPRVVLPVATLLLAAAALMNPRPILVNLGAGDEPLARGFQEWERAGPDGRTMFRWSRDGARIEIPATARAEALQIRVRWARFIPDPVELTWRVGERDASRVDVPPRGWHVRALDLGPSNGPLRLELRTFADPEALGASVDWIEIRGVQRLIPGRRATFGLLALVVLLPVATGLIAGTGAGNAVGASLLVAVPALLWHDPGQGLATLEKAAAPTFVALGALALVSRFRPGEFQPAFGGSLIAATLALLLLFHPSFHYPDVDTHARLLAAIRQDPALALDPSPYQQRTGAWMRGIGGEKVAFPYSPVFHLAAWPLALAFGDTDAVKTAAAIALGTSALFAHALARAIGLPVGSAVLAQALFVSLPVQTSRLSLALFPTLFAQALELAWLRALATRAGALDARATATLGAMMLATQLAYTGSVVNVAATGAILAVWSWTAGDKGTGVRLGLLTAATTTVVLGVSYASFIPVLWTKVLPHASSAEGAPTGVGTGAVRRAFHFYGIGMPALALAGFVHTATRAHARRVVGAAAVAGALLLLARGAAPAVFRDVKEVELLAGPVAVLASAGLTWLAARARGRPLAAAAAAAVLLYGVHRGAMAYTAGMLAVGR